MSESIGTARLLDLLAALTFSVGGAGIKACDLTSWQVASFRSGAAALALMIFLPQARRGFTPRAFVVGLAYAATVTLYVLANKLTTSANTIFLQSTSPLYILLLSPWLLREHFRARDLAIMGIVGVGMALFFVGTESPLATAPDPFHGNILAIASGLTWALTIIGLRWMGRGRPGQSGSALPAVVIGSWIAFFAGLPFALPVVQSRPLDWAIIAGLGTIQIGLAYLFLTSGIRHVPALEASLLLLLEPILNPVWSWIVHAEVPSGWSLIGGAVILGATLAKTWWDSRRPGARADGVPPVSD
jgi:DME family drug/metabolite transporter